MKIDELFNKRNILFLIACAVALFMVFKPLQDFESSGGYSVYYTHIILIPFVSVYLVYKQKKTIFSDLQYSILSGSIIMLLGLLLYLIGIFYAANSFSRNDFTAVIALSGVVFINGAFMSLYGARSYRTAIFPLLLMIFIVPLPEFLMSGMIDFLQPGSTEITNLLLTMTGVPFVREGFVFHLSGMSVEVAKQCSGIRSCIALFITALLAGYLFLHATWTRVILIAFVLPIAMFKNAVRILTLTLLGTYVDPRILQSSLHREGGAPFFVLALLLMLPVLLFLRKRELRVTGDRL
jgi:exosortase